MESDNRALLPSLLSAAIGFTTVRRAHFHAGGLMPSRSYNEANPTHRGPFA